MACGYYVVYNLSRNKVTMELKHEIKTPYPFGDTVKQYRQVLNVDVKYPAFTINDKLEIIECIGIISNNGSWNYHNNYDDSEEELFVIINDQKIRKWFTLSKEYALQIQNDNIRAWKNSLKKELLRLENISE